MFKSKHQTLLTKLGAVLEERSKVASLFKGYARLKEANHISSHFSSYFDPIIAASEAQRKEVFKVRHEVYCEELKFEPLKESRLEFDEFDSYSIHCLLQQRNSKHSAGVVSITRKDLDPSQFKREHICEISRLAIPKSFRRRSLDKFNGAGVGAINQYLAAAALTIEEGIRHTYVMMEPRLARSMRFVGIKFDQIGPVIEYHGKRAPYYINQNLLTKNLRPGFAKMLADILRSIEKQCCKE